MPGSQAQTLSTLHSFAISEGANPEAALLQGKDGALYGTTYQGGGANNKGTLFRVNANGSGFVTLHIFTGSNGEGANPLAAMIQGTDGALYGTTQYGGKNVGNGTAGYGTVFKVNPDGSGFVTLHAFTGSGSEGFDPQAALLQGKDSALYGTTQYGGGTNDLGTLFRINPDGSGFVTLHSFTGSGDDGANPNAALRQGRDGALYGTTYNGGTAGYGTVFKVNPDGSGFVTLHSFTGSGGEGKYPQDVIQGKDGALYGTTQYGGGTNDLGTLFRVNPDGSGFVTLHAFTGSGSEGSEPEAALLQGRDGALYGTTYNGGTAGYGTVFKVNPDGSGFVTLHSFTGSGGEGFDPQAALLQGKDSALYGTTQYGGGTNGRGTVFRLALPTPPRFDVNGDGHLDLLWYNQTTTALVVWLQNGLTNIGSVSLATSVDAHWQITGVANLNGDGNADFLWRNQQTGDLVVWYMKGSVYLGYDYVTKGLPLAWQIVTCADVNSDGNDDILLHNTQTGDIVVWYMQGATNLGYAYLAHAVPLAWQLVGSADFNGNGHTGLLWRNSQTGDLSVWDMNNTQLVTSYTLAKAVPLEWQVSAVGDLDGNGVPDIIWRNTRTGDVTAWLFSDPTHYSGASIASGISLNWQLVGPR